ncbi:MAG TPA: peptidylprolyl isomerase [Methylophilaceae bacterium]|nr:peptidylprolyl isomerase [Methylophilaceae bacterium]HAJ72497.1 peptidylprolyl isomerase [Methylophilaceae bacterium]
MNIKSLFISTLTLTLLSLSLPTFAADSVATVNGKAIKQSWVDYIMKDAQARGQKPSDNMKAAIINELVGSELAYQEAQKMGIDKQPDFIVNEELARRKLLVNAYLADFMKKNPVSEADKKAAYEDYKKELGDKEFNARHILVKTEAEAKDIIAQLNKGTDFAKLAKEKSLDPGSKEKGGDLGWFSPAGMVKPFSDATTALKKGELTSTPVQTQFGWHVIKLIDTRATQVPPYDKVEDGLERTLQQRKLEKMMLGLKDKAKIEVTGMDKK